MRPDVLLVDITRLKEEKGERDPVVLISYSLGGRRREKKRESFQSRICRRAILYPLETTRKEERGKGLRSRGFRQSDLESS